LTPSLEIVAVVAGLNPGPVEVLDRSFRQEDRPYLRPVLLLFEVKASAVENKSSIVFEPFDSHDTPKRPTSLPSFFDKPICACSTTFSRNCISSSTAPASSVSTFASLSKADVRKSQVDIFSSTFFNLTFFTNQISLGTKSLFDMYPPRG